MVEKASGEFQGCSDEIIRVQDGFGTEICRSESLSREPFLVLRLCLGYDWASRLICDL